MIGRELLLEIVYEAHMMGRIYNKMGEPETPGEVCEKLKKMIDLKMKATEEDK